MSPTQNTVKSMAERRVRKQKIFIAVGSVVLLGVLGFELPKIMGHKSGQSAVPAVSTAAPGVATIPDPKGALSLTNLAEALHRLGIENALCHLLQPQHVLLPHEVELFFTQTFAFLAQDRYLTDITEERHEFLDPDPADDPLRFVKHEGSQRIFGITTKPDGSGIVIGSSALTYQETWRRDERGVGQRELADPVRHRRGRRRDVRDMGGCAARRRPRTGGQDARTAR